MRISRPTTEQALVAVNLALVLNLGVIYATRDARPVQPTGSEASSEGPRTLVVVGGDSPTDAAVARPVAEAQGGVVIAVGAAGLTDAVTAQLRRAAPEQVLVLGGPAAVPEATAAALRRLTSGRVTRIAGEDRFDTAAEVATSQFSSPVRRVRIVSGDEAAAPLLTRDPVASGTPLLLVEGDRIPPGTAAALSELRPRSVEVLGGAGAVPDTVLRQLQGFASGPVVRVQ